MAISFSVSERTIISSPIVEAIRDNDELTLRNLYKSNFKKVEAMILKNSGTKEQAKDIYQESFITVWKNVRENKFVPGNETAINGYLYTIAKNKWMDYLRSPAYKKRVSYDTVKMADPVHSYSENQVTVEAFEKKLSVVMEAFNELGEACKTLLTRFYFEKKSMKEIAIELQLDTASTRNKKYRCMQTLREFALELNISTR
jgi:RNA polymerase sigma factor (sigma-70 family)